jgi:uncharacterized RDD family membrane protein YckC
MENQTPEFFEEKDLLGQVIPKITSTQHENVNLKSDSFGEQETEYEDASTGTRFGGYLIDVACIYALCFVLGIVIALMGKADLITDINSRLFALFIMLLYYCIFESAAGRTLGKFVTGTKVINEKGELPGFANILGRTLCRFIPFEPFSFFGGGPGGWHDTISGTRVVKIK